MIGAPLIVASGCQRADPAAGDVKRQRAAMAPAVTAERQAQRALLRWHDGRSGGRQPMGRRRGHGHPGEVSLKAFALRRVVAFSGVLGHCPDCRAFWPSAFANRRFMADALNLSELEGQLETLSCLLLEDPDNQELQALYDEVSEVNHKRGPPLHCAISSATARSSLLLVGHKAVRRGSPTVGCASDTATGGGNRAEHATARGSRGPTPSLSTAGPSSPSAAARRP